MNFTFNFNEWLAMRQALEVAKRKYEEFMDTFCEPSDKELSLYQIYKREIEEIDNLINKLNKPYCIKKP